MPCFACGCDPCIKMPRCRHPYSHDGPAVYGSKLADYLISEANMEDDLKSALAAVWPTSPVPDPPSGPHKRVLGCDGCDQRDAEIARLREALERLALPLAFGVPKVADPEGYARMHFAQAILDGYTLADAIRMAEQKADERAGWTRFAALGEGGG